MRLNKKKLEKIVDNSESMRQVVLQLWPDKNDCGRRYKKARELCRVYGIDISKLKSKKDIKPKEDSAFSGNILYPGYGISLGHISDNILVIGDPHLPFTRSDYLDFCKSIQIKYSCNKIVCIGDLIDHHYSSFWDTDPDGFSAGEEFDMVTDKLQEWYKVFPSMTVILGNHDRIILRKAKRNGISQKWIKDFNQALKVPNWEFTESYEDKRQKLLFIHGDNAKDPTPIVASKNYSIIQGHWHSRSYIRYINGDRFIMQVGCGIDTEAYAFHYAKFTTSIPIISCGVISDGVPIIETMKQ